MADVLDRIFDVRGARVVVTGAAGGLGLAIAEVLAACGGRVTLADVDEAALAASTARLRDAGGDVRSFAVDVADPARVHALFDDVVSAHGGVDVVFANAGIAAEPGFAAEGGQRIDTVAHETWQRVLGVNLHGVFFTLQSAAAVMKRQRSGRIVVTSSIAGLRPEPVVCYGYVTSKAAVLNLVRQAALELAPYGVHVNAICPGPFKGTRIGGGATLDPDPDAERGWAATVPLGRMAEPDELKGLALLLASPASSFVTGAAFVVDGGSTLV